MTHAVLTIRRLIPVFDWFLGSPFLFVVYAVSVAPLFGAGRGFGIPYLFWGESGRITFLGGAGLGMLAAELAVVGFIFTTHPGSAASSQIVLDMATYLVKVGLFTLILGSLSVLSGVAKDASSRYLLPPGVLAGLCVGYVGIRFAEWILRQPAVSGLTATWGIDGLRLHLISTMFFLFYGGLYLLLRRLETSGQAETLQRVPPALAIGLFLGVVVAVWGFGSFWIRSLFPQTWPGVTVMVILLLTFINGLVSRAYRYPDLEKPGSGAMPELLSDRDTLVRWRAQTREEKPILAVVTADGGGIRAGMWASVVLESIEGKLDEFPHRIRLVTGASGGMLGAASYVAALPSSPTDARPSVIRAVSASGLAPLASALAFQDLWIPGSRTYDRGQAIERIWERNSGQALMKPLASLSEGEKEGWRPSLAFTPMIVEKGIRLVVSNLNLTDVLTPRNTGDDPHELVSGLQLGSDVKLNWSALRLSTAIRMNASFPYALPPAILPKVKVGEREEELRLVDAGYYDEQGANLAALWLWEHREWIAENTRGVALIQTRDARYKEEDRQPSLTDRAVTIVRRGFFDITTPVEAAFSSLNTGMHRRNAAQVAALVDYFAGRGPDFFHPFIFSMSGEASLSWHLTEAEKDSIRGAIVSPDASKELETLTHWWSTRPDAPR